MGDPQAREDGPRAGIRPDWDVPVGADQPTEERQRSVPVTRLLFLLAVTVAAAAYTVMAFDLEWRIQGGQIGPGFFPRIVGGLTILGCLVALARMLLGGAGSSSASSSASASADADEEAELGIESDGRTDAPVTALAVGCMAVCYVAFEPLGALLASVLFLALLLSLVNRGHHLQNAVVSIAVPVGLYVLFEVFLDSGLPPGLVLPPL